MSGTDSLHHSLHRVQTVSAVCRRMIAVAAVDHQNVVCHRASQCLLGLAVRWLHWRPACCQFQRPVQTEHQTRSPTQHKHARATVPRITWPSMQLHGLLQFRSSPRHLRSIEHSLLHPRSQDRVREPSFLPRRPNCLELVTAGLDERF